MLKDVVLIIKENFPLSNPKRDKSRGKEEHIRVTKGFSFRELKLIPSLNIIKKEQDTSYSTAYNTIFVEFKNNVIPIVISDRNEKKNGDSILQKELTPQKLGVEGVVKILESAQVLSNIDDKLGNMLKNISRRFFCNAVFVKEDLMDNYFSFEEYSNIITGIIVNNKGDKIIGIPKGTKNSKPEIFFEDDEKGLFNAIIFLISTLISEYSNREVFNGIINNLIVTPVKIIHFSCNNRRLEFEEPFDLEYKLHYWGNFKNPTNNMVGIKAII